VGKKRKRKEKINPVCLHSFAQCWLWHDSDHSEPHEGDRHLDSNCVRCPDGHTYSNPLRSTCSNGQRGGRVRRIYAFPIDAKGAPCSMDACHTHTGSMGRSLGSCGNGLRGYQPARCLPASMGPQPWELRKQGIAYRNGFENYRLQWGRSLGSCGNNARSVKPPKKRCFNGAAALGAAETRLVPVTEQLRKVLQWGRSLGSCGNGPRVSSCRNQWLHPLSREPTL
jgi:hypothetical protein